LEPPFKRNEAAAMPSLRDTWLRFKAIGGIGPARNDPAHARKHGFSHPYGQLRAGGMGRFGWPSCGEYRPMAYVRRAPASWFEALMAIPIGSVIPAEAGIQRALAIEESGDAGSRLSPG